jgi:hypothetical protein
VITAELQFLPSSKRQTVETFLGLPQELRPIRRSLGEDDIGTPIGDPDQFLDGVEESDSGFFLKGPGVMYDFIFARNRPTICNCFLEVQPHLAKILLIHMAAAQPIFGFACTTDELDEHNRITIKLGINSIESWVGQDTQKYIPGLYWITLLPAVLAEKHGVPLSTLGKVALEHIRLEGDQHLFRFYERPEDWRSASNVAELSSSLSGVFNIEKIKPQLRTAKNFFDLDKMLRNWE